MKKWKNVTNEFTKEQRKYKKLYLEITEIMDDCIEVSLYSSQTEPCEIYISFGCLFGIIYTDMENGYELREQIKKDLVEEYEKNGEPSDEFIDSFCKKYDVCIPNDIFFDMSGFF